MPGQAGKPRRPGLRPLRKPWHLKRPPTQAATGGRPGRARSRRATRREVRSRLRHRQHHLPGQILGFVAGAAVVAILDPHKTLAIDSVTFGLSALILVTGVRARPAPARDGAIRSSLW